MPKRSLFFQTFSRKKQNKNTTTTTNKTQAHLIYLDQGVR